MENLQQQNLFPKPLTQSLHRQAGVATLIATVVLLVVVTISALMVARSAFFELKVSGSDIRDKEAYASAISGLDYGIQWLINGNEVWSLLDPDDGSGVKGAVAYAPNPGLNAVQRADDYTFDPDGDGTPTISYELMSDENEAAAIVRARSRATAVKTSEVTKGVEVMVIKASLLRPSIIDGPPLVVDHCIPESADVVGGTPKIFPALIKTNPQNPPNAEFEVRTDGVPAGPLRQDSDGNYIPRTEPSIASVNEGSASDCVHEGHFTSYYVDNKTDGYAPYDQNNDNNIPILDESGTPLVDKQYSTTAENGGQINFYNSFFSISRAELQNLSHSRPTSIIYVDKEYASGPNSTHAYPFNNNNWKASPLGSDAKDPATGEYNDQVVLFFSKEYGCPTINGGGGSAVQIYGLVYIDTENCDLGGWGQVKIYGTLAVSGNMNKFNANVEIHDRSLDTFAGADSPFTVVSIVPGSWKDF